MLIKFSNRQIVSAVESPSDPYFQNFKTELIRDFKPISGAICIYRLDNHTHIQNIKTRLKIYNVILLDSYKTFELLFVNITPEKFNFQGYYLFVLINGWMTEIDKIFQAMWSKSIINVNVIFEEKTNIKLNTFLPFKRMACGDTNSVNHGYFSRGNFSMKVESIFPDKLRNMFKCEIRLVTFNRCPAACVKVKGGTPTVTGFDIAIIETIQDAMNFKLKTTILLGSEQWGNVYPNGTKTGAINHITSNKSDIAVGNFVLRSSRTSLMDPSVVYFSFPVIMAIPPGERLTAFEKLLRPFELYVWIAVLVTVSIGVLVILVLDLKLKKFRAFVWGANIRVPIMHMLVVIFGGSSQKLPRRNFARYLLMMFLLFCLVQRSIYQGLLYIYMKSDGRHREVQSIDEMVERGFQFYMFDSYVDTIASQPIIYDK